MPLWGGELDAVLGAHALLDSAHTRLNPEHKIHESNMGALLHRFTDSDHISNVIIDTLRGKALVFAKLQQAMLEEIVTLPTGKRIWMADPDSRSSRGGEEGREEVPHAMGAIALEGGAEISPRYAFSLPDITEVCMKFPLTIQAVLLVGLVPDARIVVYHKCFGMYSPEKRVVIRFGPGDCVVLRGDFVYSLAAAERHSCYAECLLTVKGTNDGLENTFFKASCTSRKCTYCDFMTSSNTNLHNHDRLCPDNRRRGEIRSQKKKNNLQGKPADSADDGIH
ncbi:hypothetical protein PHYPSEUDO_000992 [Phytophthora pseudosyringae]|uniref:Uncharacterized protein n=1 Tax=Phytophthora pseudosyringae TaxID=221518 RepID=A0A8T1VXC1_9STRA|nr:hypothetical protein PHYPSEUDO_000992 [Phytophthora pseudosyringae]